MSTDPVIYDELLYTSVNGRVAIYDLEEKRDPRWVTEQGIAGTSEPPPSMKLTCT
ncbi:hypothetical protein C440_16921 [Haloferax mucosum ATCC BAA-1512]|uniref:Uncharacterized protein n=1 Tax=Haloferax mucosum ATCC BAA-1512 TaxID=662479 RepID=M0I0Y8_9EURY|nr:hypothetical protein [Haloferax mucosum]ELZ90381.1 hypothetical protein C440_16921 [Haloferax mucosum ATCC BAA-1512]